MLRFIVTAWQEGKRSYPTGYGRQAVRRLVKRFVVAADASDTAAQLADRQLAEQLVTWTSLEVEPETMENVQ